MGNGKSDRMAAGLLLLLIIGPQMWGKINLQTMQNNITQTRHWEMSRQTTDSFAPTPGSSADLIKLDRIFSLSILLSGFGTLAMLGFLNLRSRHFFRDIVKTLDELAGKIDVTSFTAKKDGDQLMEDTRLQSASVARTAGTHKRVAELSRKSTTLSDSARDRIRSYTEKINAANLTLKQLTASMDDIIDAGRGIKKVVDDIDDIASKTNVLAINAGVEAIKAGGSGATFGVIAQEVRNLALSAGSSASQTNALIDAMISKINRGADNVAKAVAAFRGTHAFVEEIQTNMETISDAARNQSESLNDLEEVIATLESLTGRNVENANKTNTISRELQENAEALRIFLSHIICSTISGKKPPARVLSHTLESLQELARHLKTADTEISSHRHLLDQWRTGFPYDTEAVYSCDRDGRFIYSDPPAGIDNAEIRPWWQNAVSGRPYISPVYISAINHKPCCTISVPFDCNENAIAGVLGVDIKL